jgi:hypothetical protein
VVLGAAKRFPGARKRTSAKTTSSQGKTAVFPTKAAGVSEKPPPRVLCRCAPYPCGFESDGSSMVDTPFGIPVTACFRRRVVSQNVPLALGGLYEPGQRGGRFRVGVYDTRTVHELGILRVLLGRAVRTTVTAAVQTQSKQSGNSNTVVSVKTAHPIRFVTGTERPRLKKNQHGYNNHSFSAGWLQDGKAKAVCEKSAKTTNRLSEMLLALQWALFINVTVHQRRLV